MYRPTKAVATYVPANATKIHDVDRHLRDELFISTEDWREKYIPGFRVRERATGVLRCLGETHISTWIPGPNQLDRGGELGGIQRKR